MRRTIMDATCRKTWCDKLKHSVLILPRYSVMNIEETVKFCCHLSEIRLVD
jgi:hypothetical protein